METTNQDEGQDADDLIAWIARQPEDKVSVGDLCALIGREVDGILAREKKRHLGVRKDT